MVLQTLRGPDGTEGTVFRLVGRLHRYLSKMP